MYLSDLCGGYAFWQRNHAGDQRVKEVRACSSRLRRGTSPKSQWLRRLTRVNIFGGVCMEVYSGRLSPNETVQDHFEPLKTTDLSKRQAKQ